MLICGQNSIVNGRLQPFFFSIFYACVSILLLFLTKMRLGARVPLYQILTFRLLAVDLRNVIYTGT
jgi:hypothetical protein